LKNLNSSTAHAKATQARLMVVNKEWGQLEVFSGCKKSVLTPSKHSFCSRIVRYVNGSNWLETTAWCLA